ncbi:MAG: NAD-dependent epimerase/dehydratase family protein [Acidobacteriota bacterium]
MRMFVTGANGYIGSAVAAACSRAGHEVYGLVRSEEKAKRLLAMEINPVIGSMGGPSTYEDVARECEVFIHCAVEYSAQLWELDRTTIVTALASAEKGRTRLFIYTSGVWVYGDTGDAMADESSALNLPAMMAPRLDGEQLVLGANRRGLRTLVLRPGCVYGGRGGLTGGWFDSAVRAGAARVIGDGGNRWAMIHRSDLAEAYLRAAESPWGGEVFNLTDRSRFTVAECARAASHAAGAGGRITVVPLAEAVASMGPMAEPLAFTQHVDSSKAVRLLGWQPRHGGFVDGVDRYFAAWRAHQA